MTGGERRKPIDCCINSGPLFERGGGNILMARSPGNIINKCAYRGNTQSVVHRCDIHQRLEGTLSSFVVVVVIT